MNFNEISKKNGLNSGGKILFNCNLRLGQVHIIVSDTFNSINTGYPQKESRWITE